LSPQRTVGISVHNVSSVDRMIDRYDKLVQTLLEVA
jgi:hypothetical protein